MLARSWACVWVRGVSAWACVWVRGVTAWAYVWVRGVSAACHLPATACLYCGGGPACYSLPAYP